jgi:hypothetical protein
MDQGNLDQKKLHLIFIGLMVVSGVVVFFITRQWPALRDFPVPPIIWPLGVSLIFDIVTMPRVAQGRLPPLDMQVRVLGVLAGALTYAGLSALS